MTRALIFALAFGAVGCLGDPFTVGAVDSGALEVPLMVDGGAFDVTPDGGEPETAMPESDAGVPPLDAEAPPTVDAAPERPDATPTCDPSACANACTPFYEIRCCVTSTRCGCALTDGSRCR